MQFSGRDIEKQCNRMRLLKGKALYASKKVQDFYVIRKPEEVQRFLEEKNEISVLGADALDCLAKDEERVYVIGGHVIGSQEEPYEIFIVIDDGLPQDRIISSRCTCADYEAGTPFCKHCVAVAHNFVMQSLEEKLAEHLVSGKELEEKRTRSSGESLEPVCDAFGRVPDTKEYAKVYDRKGSSSSGAIMQLIKEYSGIESAITSYEKPDLESTVVLPHSVELVANVNIDRKQKVTVDFRIGVDKKYVVKDVEEFYRHVEEKEFHSYGKKLAFVHTREMFTKDSLFYLDMIADVFSMRQEYYIPQSVRYLQISEGYIEQLFLRQIGGSIFVNSTKCRVVDENPKLTLYVKKAEYGATLSIEDILYVTCLNHSFIIDLKKCVVYCVSEGFGRYMIPFIRTFREYRDWNYVESFRAKQQLTCYLNHRDYVSFCGHVLRKLERYLNVEEEDVDLIEYMPEECRIFVYLDTPEPDIVTCNMKAVYGKAEYNISDWAAKQEGEFRDFEKEQQVYFVAKQYFPKEQRKEKDYLLYCDTEENMYQLLQSGITELKEYGQVYVSEDIRQLNIRKSPKITAGIQVKGNLLELNVAIPDMSDAEIGEILSAYRLKKKYFRMKNGDFLQLKENGFGMLAKMSSGLGIADREWEKGSVTVPMYRANYIDAVMKERDQSMSVVRSSEFKAIIRNMKEVEDSDYEVPKEVHAELRGYQKTGYRWLRMLAHYHFGGVLADDMGLGKTLQILTLLQSAVLEPDYDRQQQVSLIVCPTSLVYNWESECKKFTPDLKCRVIVGGVRERKEQLASLENVDIVVTSYDLLKRDLAYYQEKKFQYMIVDEAQYIKNATTLAAKSVKRIDAGYRYALTGTPIENRLSDLWSIFDFVMPGYLYTYERFRNEFELPIVSEKDAECMSNLQKLVTPFILRRRKKDVLKDLPEKIENVIYTNMTKEQSKCYRARYLQLKKSLAEQPDTEFGREKLKVLAELTRLRQLCCDPALFMENYDGGSGKVDAFLSIVEELTENGSKILVFSQFASMLSILQNELDEKGIVTLLLTGKNSKEERRNMIEQFQAGEVAVFLISLKAGGTGLNLTAADTVIHFDPWWNVAAQNQATDRAHRIGQEKVVTVMQLVTKNSVEERIIELQNRKKELVEQVIEGEEVASASLTKEEIMQLLEDF